MNILESTARLEDGLLDADDDVPAASESAESAGNNAAHSGLLSSTIMMVDDESMNMEVIQMFLEDAGYRNFVTTDDSTQAMAIMLETQPDILLLDLQMPKVTGFDIMKLMAAHPKLCHLPTLVLTAASEPDIKLKALEMGATDFLSKPVDPSELVLRLKNTLAAKAYQDHLTFFDSLTGLPNRDMFMNRLSLLLKRAGETGHQLSILQIGLERYRHAVDILGPALGDHVLREVAKRIEQTMLHFEKAEATMLEESWRNVARISGSEFVAVLPVDGSLSLVQALAQQLQYALDQPIEAGGQDVFVAPVVGIGAYPQDGADSDTLVKHAGVAQNHASHENGEPIRFYSGELNARAHKNLAMEASLRKALELSQLKLFYQPKIDLHSGRIVGAEALVRWLHPEMGLINPQDFIPLSEETGVIIPMGEWILYEACRQTAAWIDAGHEGFSMSVNVSAKQFLSGDLLGMVSGALRKHGLPGANLTLELTESMIMKDPEANIATLKQIRDMGMKLSIDDFGTGYSSLSYLNKFPLSELKIDYSFMRSVHLEPEDATIVGAIIALAHSLGLQVVAEGVEQSPQVAFLQGHGCELCQGFLFSRPVPEEEFVELLSRKESFI